jgi:hypothetical protein
LSSAANPAPESLLLALTATVKASGKTVPTGSVQFFIDGVLIGSAPLTPGGKATSTGTIQIIHFAVGTHRVVALYLGSSGLASSTSATLAQVIQ